MKNVILDDRTKLKRLIGEGGLSQTQIARALEGVSKEMFKEAFEMANHGCEPGLCESCYGSFKELAEFFEHAAKKRRAVVKTIY